MQGNMYFTDLYSDNKDFVKQYVQSDVW